MAGGDDQLRGVVGVRRAESFVLARDAGINLAVLRVHVELIDRPLRHAFMHCRLRRGGVGGPDDEVTIDIRRGVLAVGQFLGGDVPRSMGIAGGRLGALRERGCDYQGYRENDSRKTKHTGSPLTIVSAPVGRNGLWT